MAVRKISLMYKMFGKSEHYCRDCFHFGRILVGDKRKVRKCEVYGVTASEASDWKASYQSCGLFNKEYDGRNIIDFVTPERKREIVNEPLEGQIELLEVTLNE